MDKPTASQARMLTEIAHAAAKGRHRVVLSTHYPDQTFALGSEMRPSGMRLFPLASRVRLRRDHRPINQGLEPKRSDWMKLSARNIIAGKVTITNEAVSELGLSEAAHAVIKASGVVIAVD